MAKSGKHAGLCTSSMAPKVHEAIIISPAPIPCRPFLTEQQLILGPLFGNYNHSSCIRMSCCDNVEMQRDHPMAAQVRHAALCRRSMAPAPYTICAMAGTSLGSLQMPPKKMLRATWATSSALFIRLSRYCAIVFVPLSLPCVTLGSVLVPLAGDVCRVLS